MRFTKPHHLIFAAAALTGLAAFLSAAAPPPQLEATALASPAITLTLDAAQSKVRWTVPTTLHTVHGTFAVTSGSLRFDPDSGKASGEVVVNTKSGESGNNSRDARMHKEILETQKFPDAVFHPTQIEGKVAPSGPSDVKVHGTFSVHGSDHEITALVHAELSGHTWKGTGKFDVPYKAWGVKDPSNFFLKVNHVVAVEIEMAGSLQPAK